MTNRGLRTLEAGRFLYRIYRSRRATRGQTPEEDILWFGPGPGQTPRHRFDAPDGSYGVCYLAREPPGSFVETFLRDPQMAGPGVRILAASELAAHECVRVRVRRDLRLAQLRGSGLSWRGVTASVSATVRYAESQKLSARIHGEPSKPAGIEYRCRHDNDQIAVALFDRAKTTLEVRFDTIESCLALANRLDGVYPFAVDRKG